MDDRVELNALGRTGATRKDDHGLEDAGVAAEAAAPAESSVAIEVSAEDGEALYGEMELVTGATAELLNESNALVGAVPRRSSG